MSTLTDQMEHQSIGWSHLKIIRRLGRFVLRMDLCTFVIFILYVFACRGGYAQVLLVLQLSTMKHFAVKCIRKRQVLQLQARNHEFDIMRSMSPHPHVVTVYHMFQSDRSIYILMEYCGGNDLFHVLAKHGHCGEPIARRIVRQLLGAVAHIHASGVLHRDIKPENIVLVSKSHASKLDDDEVEVKLIDFGLAAFWHPPQSIILDRVGTMAYSAPEVLQGHNFGPSCDMWAVGIITFLLLSGYHPFDEYGEDQAEATANRIVSAQWSFDDDIWDHTSVEAKSFISNLMVHVWLTEHV